jgi:hypothetical protein
MFPTAEESSLVEAQSATVPNSRNVGTQKKAPEEIRRLLYTSFVTMPLAALLAVTLIF